MTAAPGRGKRPLVATQEVADVAQVSFVPGVSSSLSLLVRFCPENRQKSVMLKPKDGASKTSNHKPATNTAASAGPA